MAHEELKALYEIDKQHSDAPWKWWELLDFDGSWISLSSRPSWNVAATYRRKPDVPVWYPIGRHPAESMADDARKWRELEAFYQGNGIMDTAKKFLEIIKPKPKLIQGYTAEQWQAIIDGGFLCEFSDDGGNEDDSVRISVLRELCPERFPFYSGFGSKWKYCRPLRMKGVRQPWFGGKRPVSGNARVSYVLRDGYKEQTEAGRIRWTNKGIMSDIVEFIEL